jgi:hypothetical protein
MVNGRIIVGSKTEVPGSRKMYSWHDEWVESYDIDYDGAIDKEVAERIIAAFKKSSEHIAKDRHGYGALRWQGADREITVTSDKKLAVKRIICLTD